MRIAYLDCFSGISGDMFLGALVDAGVSAELLRRDGGGPEYRSAAGDFPREAQRASPPPKLMSSCTARKRCRARSSGATGSGTHHARPQHRTHVELREQHDSRAEPRGQRCPQPAQTWPWSEGNPGDHRCRDRQIAQSRLRSTSSRRWAQPKPRSTTVDIEQIHFHEVGAEDAMVDIVCAALAPRPSTSRDRLLAVERRRWNREVRPRNSSGPGSRHIGIAAGRSGLFVAAFRRNW